MNAREFLGTVPLFADVLYAGELDALATGTRRSEFDRGAVSVRIGSKITVPRRAIDGELAPKADPPHATSWRKGEKLNPTFSGKMPDLRPFLLTLSNSQRSTTDCSVQPAFRSRSLI